MELLLIVHLLQFQILKTIYVYMLCSPTQNYLHLKVTLHYRETFSDQKKETECFSFLAFLFWQGFGIFMVAPKHYQCYI